MGFRKLTAYPRWQSWLWTPLKVSRSWPMFCFVYMEKRDIQLQWTYSVFVLDFRWRPSAVSCLIPCLNRKYPCLRQRNHWCCTLWYTHCHFQKLTPTSNPFDFVLQPDLIVCDVCHSTSKTRPPEDCQITSLPLQVTTFYSWAIVSTDRRRHRPFSKNSNLWNHCTHRDVLNRIFLICHPGVRYEVGHFCASS